MVALLAAGSTSLIAFGCMAAVGAAVWGSQKYKERQAEKRSEEIRQLYASVHSERPRK
ncbi:MAG TPA: hypothetical protein VNM14_06540 [Planctomycetota bacterium]|jgi:hypothetical protein|nr:hypothetical protein [Planctomycetota bacterium]